MLVRNTYYSYMYWNDYIFGADSAEMWLVVWTLALRKCKGHISGELDVRFRDGEKLRFYPEDAG